MFQVAEKETPSAEPSVIVLPTFDDKERKPTEKVTSDIALL